MRRGLSKVIHTFGMGLPKLAETSDSGVMKPERDPVLHWALVIFTWFAAWQLVLGNPVPSQGIWVTKKIARIWLAPVTESNRLTRPYQAPLTEWGSGHRGVDYATTEGAVVLAPADGTIAFGGTVATKPVLAVQHGAVRSAFEPVCGLLPVGTRVTAGQLIGTVCGQGYRSHCDPLLCLHFSARNESGYLSPQYLMGQLYPSRLIA